MKEYKDNLDRAVDALKNERIPVNPPQDVVAATIAKLAETAGEPRTSNFEKPITIIERIKAMKRFTKLAVAAMIIVAVVISVNLWDKTIPAASAAEVFSQAVKAMGNLKSVYIKLQMRTISHDNFELIGLDYDLVPIEMWKEFDDTPYGKWRVEKAGRVVVMDGKSSLLLIRPNHAAKGGVNTGFVEWLRDMLDIEQVIDRQLQLAKELGLDLQLTHEQGGDGRGKLVVTVEAKAQGDFTNDYVKNMTICESDNRRIYRFDAQTKLLENLEVYIHTDNGDVLVLQVQEIKYNPELAPSLFSLELPADVIWFEQPQKIAGNTRYEQMTPKEVASAFFQACADENWDEFLKFWPATAVDQKIKDYLGGLEIISVGEPFKSGLYPGWFVPYEIRFKSGDVKKMNLAVRNDNPARRYIVDGGF